VKKTVKKASFYHPSYDRISAMNNFQTAIENISVWELTDHCAS